MKNPATPIIKAYTENLKKVRLSSMAEAAKAISGVVLEMCNEDISDSENVEKIKLFCEKGLGLENKEGE